MSTLKAFSLIELMVVITIVGVLSAVALPSYRDYVSRAKMAAVFTIVEAQKAYAVEEYLKGSQTNRFLSGAGLPAGVSAISTTFDSETGAAYIQVDFSVSSAISSAFTGGFAVIYQVAEQNGAYKLTCNSTATGFPSGISGANLTKIMGFVNALTPDNPC